LPAPASEMNTTRVTGVFIYSGRYSPFVAVQSIYKNPLATFQYAL
jgi:hypothetical protein